MTCAKGSQRPAWANRNKLPSTEARQRIIVFIAGGATYSEARSCYELSNKWNRDVILGATEMITPSTFIRELARSRDSRQSLKLSMDQVRSVPPPQQTKPSMPPSQQQGGLPSRPHPQQRTVSDQSPASSDPRNGMGGPRPAPQRGYGTGHTNSLVPSHGSGHDKDQDKDKKKKKKFGMF